MSFFIVTSPNKSIPGLLMLDKRVDCELVVEKMTCAGNDECEEVVDFSVVNNCPSFESKIEREDRILAE